MRTNSGLWALALAISPAGALSPPPRRRVLPKWPAQETVIPHLADGDISPLPTGPARPAFGKVELFKRYSMGEGTCGFAAGYHCEWPPFLVSLGWRSSAGFASLLWKVPQLLTTTQPSPGRAMKLARAV
jgi:hypothetical protein